MLARAEQAAAHVATFGAARPLANGAGDDASPARLANGALGLVGHSHLDVAWLWTYEEASRKALRTFATAVRQLELDPQFVFTQSQPQLYEFVRELDPELFARVATLARAGRFDATGAALWVESDCNLPSGESLLRQLAAGCGYVEREFGTQASVAWLSRFVRLSQHVTVAAATRRAVSAFGTTKLGWNDSTTFPHCAFSCGKVPTAAA